MLKPIKYVFFIEFAVCHLAAVASGTWYCGDGETIPLDKVCDGIVDCLNGHDETAKACIFNTCKDDQYRCAYGGCVHADRKCDKEIHCLDRSDETEFLCEPEESIWQKVQGHCTDEEYQCQNSECIEQMALCDGKLDCTDGTDEKVSSCAHMLCPHKSFRCGYGACISIRQVCDNIWDCKDGSDELCSRSWKKIQNLQRYLPRTPVKISGCVIPYDNVHLQVVRSRTNEIISYFDEIPPNEEVKFKCTAGFALTGVERLVCTDNNWYRQWPNCTNSSKLPVCRSNEVACDNGECIHLELLCNGIKNCKDGSDETPKKCLNRTCTPNEFQCKYGACVHTKLICDDVSHCSDGSDETRLLCAKNDDEAFGILQGGCKPTDDEDLAECRSGECIALPLICDGTPNCADRSDETVEMCAHMKCTNASFTCAYGACVPSTAHCDGRINCADGSDEIDEICTTIEAARAKHEEEYNFNDNYVTNLEKTEALAEQRIHAYEQMLEQSVLHNFDERNLTGSGYRYCTIPLDRVALRAEMGHETLKIGIRVKIGSVVKFICDESGQPVNEESELLCMPQGVWSGDVPRCEKRCPPVPQQISKMARCSYRRKKVDCFREYHQPGTELRIICAAGYNAITSERRTASLCKFDGTWDLVPLKCEPRCVELPKDNLSEPQQKILVNFFRLSTMTTDPRNRHYERVFNGTILSPKMVLTSAQYFDDTRLPNSLTARDPTIYKVLPARLATNSFYQNDEAPESHNISQIIFADNLPLGDEEMPAIAVLVDYFVLNTATTLPICLKFSRSCLSETRAGDLTIEQRDNKGIAYLLNDCFVIIGKNGLIHMDKYREWLEMQVMHYNYLL